MAVNRTPTREVIQDPEMEKWDAILRVGKKAHDEKVVAVFRENEKYLSGDQMSLKNGTKVSVMTNLYRTVKNVMVAALYSRNPRPKVIPEMMSLPSPKNLLGATVQRARMNERRRQALMDEAMLSKACKESDLQYEAQTAVAGAIAAPRWAMLIGYSSVRGATEGKGEKEKYVIPETKDPLQVGVPLDENARFGGVTKERIWHRSLPCDMYFYAPEATCISEAAWACVDEVVASEDVWNNENFNKNTRGKVRPTETPHEAGWMSTQDGWNDGSYKSSGLGHRAVPESSKFVRLRTLYDMKGKKVRVYAVGNEHLGWLREQKWKWKKLEGYPIVELCFEPGVNSQWGSSILQNLRGVQDEMNLLDYQWRMYQSRILGITIMEKGAFDPEEMEKWLNAEYADLIIKNPGRDYPKNFEGPNWMMQLMGRRKDLWEIFERESHLSEWYTIGKSMHTRSATEADALKQGLSTYINEKVQRVETFVADIYRKSLQLMHEAYTEKQAIRIIGELGPEWAIWDPETSREELAVSVVPYSALPVSPSVDLQRKSQTMQIATQVSQVVPEMMNLPMIIHDLIVAMNPGDDVETYFNMDVVEVTMQNMEKRKQMAAVMAMQQQQGGGQGGGMGGGGPMMPGSIAPPTAPGLLGEGA